MPKSAQPFRVSKTGKNRKTETRPADTDHEIGASILSARLPLLIEDWLADCESAHFSSRTIELRRDLTARLLRFLSQNQHRYCGTRELRLFFASLINERTGKPLRPVTADTYRRNFSALFNWLIREGELQESPLARIRKPPVKTDIIQPLSQEQIEALVAAARRDPNPRLRARNTALLLFLLDTGARSSEARELTYENLDLTHRQASLLGKGNKRRTVYFSKRTARALYHYIDTQSQEPFRCVFLTESGINPHDQFTRRGFYQVISKLFLRAGIKASKRGPHLLRHTFAIHYLRGGGRQKELMMMLGHEDMKQTNAYTALAEADLEEQHRRCSPVERMKL
jgi:integrase/recombinase XerD